MRHPDPESLALSALGEDVLDPDERAHVLACDDCSAEVASLRRVVDTARGVEPLRVPTLAGDAPAAIDAGAEPPPPRVWAGVAAELGLSPDLAPDLSSPPAPRVGDETSSWPAGPSHRSPGRSPRPLPIDARRDAARRPAPRSPGSSAPSSARPSARARGRRAPGLLLVGAVAVVAAVVGSLVTTWWSATTDDEPTTAVLAAPLTPVEGAPPASGEAEVVAATGDAAVPSLTVTVSGLPAVPGYHGVWLIDADSGEMVALGVLPGSAGDASGSFVLPEGLDLSTYDLVDVSDEPLDGDPTHSGVSLLRGTLAAGPAGA